MFLHTAYTMQPILYSLYYAAYTIQPILCSLYYAAYTIQSILYSLYYTVYTTDMPFMQPSYNAYHDYFLHTYLQFEYFGVHERRFTIKPYWLIYGTILIDLLRSCCFECGKAYKIYLTHRTYKYKNIETADCRLYQTQFCCN